MFQKQNLHLFRIWRELVLSDGAVLEQIFQWKLCESSLELNV